MRGEEEKRITHSYNQPHYVMPLESYLYNTLQRFYVCDSVAWLRL